MPRTPAALVARLETLTGTDGACCALDLRVKAAQARGVPAFKAALVRTRALSDEARLLAATLLRDEGELCACELQAALQLTHATVSHHMRVLSDAGLVSCQRRGKWIHYRLASGAEAWLP